MNPRRRYLLTKINLFSQNPEEDVFPDDAYHIIMHENGLEKMVKVAIGGFMEENRDPQSYREWINTAQKGGYDFRIYMLGREIFRASMLLCSPVIHNALFLALKYHEGKKRKAGNHPYLEHPFTVGFMLWRQRFAPAVVAAGYCHDLLEDTSCPEGEILQACGPEVLQIVKAVTNDAALADKKDWEKKKIKYVREVRLGGEAAIAVAVTDKIANLYSLLDQYEIEGSRVWRHFNRGKNKKIWFERMILNMAKENWSHEMIGEFEKLIGRLDKTEA